MEGLGGMGGMGGMGCIGGTEKTWDMEGISRWGKMGPNGGI